MEGCGAAAWGRATCVAGGRGRWGWGGMHVAIGCGSPGAAILIVPLSWSCRGAPAAKTLLYIDRWALCVGRTSAPASRGYTASRLLSPES